MFEFHRQISQRFTQRNLVSRSEVSSCFLVLGTRVGWWKLNIQLSTFLLLKLYGGGCSNSTIQSSRFDWSMSCRIYLLLCCSSFATRQQLFSLTFDRVTTFRRRFGMPFQCIQISRIHLNHLLILLSSNHVEIVLLRWWFRRYCLPSIKSSKET